MGQLRTRALALTVATLLTAGGAALAVGAVTPGAATATGTARPPQHLGSVAGEALDAATTRAAPGARDERRPRVASDAAAPVIERLPVPEAAPPDPYAPTPEVVLGRLEIPAIGLSRDLHEGVTLTAIDRGPSHWPGTAMPGQVGNVVVAGHRTTHSRPFLDLDRVEPGDEMVLTTVAGRYVYEHVGTGIVPPSGTHIVEQSREHTATLFACHPKGSARQRIVGHFELVESDPNPAILDGRIL